MTSWWIRLSRYLAGVQEHTGAQAPPVAAARGASMSSARQALDAAALPHAGICPPGTVDLDVCFFGWLAGAVPRSEPSLAPPEQELLAHLDAVLLSEDLRAELIPRARSAIPQLLHSLREEKQSARDLAARVARDPNLVVEVIRLANGVGYGADAPITDLMQAISRLGTDGLRRAIAKVLLKPIFDAQADPLLGRSAQRIWQHSEIQANVCLQQALVARIDPFEAYLAGLMHNVGWTAAFRAIDRSPQGAPPEFTSAFIHALVPRRDRFFGVLVRSWDLSQSLSALANEVIAVGFANVNSPLGQVLLSADRAACWQLLQAAGLPLAEPVKGSGPI